MPQAEAEEVAPGELYARHYFAAASLRQSISLGALLQCESMLCRKQVFSRLTVISYGICCCTQWAYSKQRALSPFSALIMASKFV